MEKEEFKNLSLKLIYFLDKYEAIELSSVDKNRLEQEVNNLYNKIEERKK